jgi:hypothetical protein
MEFFPWLTAEGVTSATTCEPSLASKTTNSLLLSRFVDTCAKTALEFEAWLDGRFIPGAASRQREHKLHLTGVGGLRHTKKLLQLVW